MKELRSQLTTIIQREWYKNNTYRLPTGSVAYTYKITPRALIILRDFWTVGIYEVKCDIFNYQKTFTATNIDEAKEIALQLIRDEIDEQIGTFSAIKDVLI